MSDAQRLMDALNRDPVAVEALRGTLAKARELRIPDDQIQKAVDLITLVAIKRNPEAMKGLCDLSFETTYKEG